MSEKICPVCRGRGGDVTVSCPDCGGTGANPNEDNAFGQCHTCHGDGEIQEDICSRCNGDGTIGEDDDDPEDGGDDNQDGAEDDKGDDEKSDKQ